ncbi:hypothetical protein RRG08_044014 [Elysia crispata]|uniref:Uncharacterized protein n=1 Tax=Elysia crispata TaxID=231223 RepID=A0AAE0Y2E6_9GAST|nr:hypothetical protein RRG08_044014 [Elysia crispata]
MCDVIRQRQRDIIASVRCKKTETETDIIASVRCNETETDIIASVRCNKTETDIIASVRCKKTETETDIIASVRCPAATTACSSRQAQQQPLLAHLARPSSNHCLLISPGQAATTARSCY